MSTLPDTSPPSSKESRPVLPGPRQAVLVGELVLDQLLGAWRQQALPQLLARRPRVTRWCVRRFVAPVLWATGDAFGDDESPLPALLFLLRWAMGQLRPDGAAFTAPIERTAWLDAPAWRPFLALACHYEMLPMASFRDRYHERADEPAASRLCGLWDIAPSSFYRHLEKGRRQLADLLLDQPMPSERLIALARAAQAAACERLGLHDEPARAAWHARLADTAALRGQARTALWHRLQVADVAGAAQLLQRFGPQLADDALTDRLLQLLPAGALEGRDFIRLLLARAGLARLRGVGDQEWRLCEQALRLASADEDRLMTGIACSALGKFHESRDADRAFACFQQSAEFLERACATPDEAAEARPHYQATLVQLAWLYTLRNDPRARPVLERAAELRDPQADPDDGLATLEQAWGEYWRRSGDFPRALEAMHRALQIYARTGNQAKVLRCHGNLALLYGHLGQVERSMAYSRRVIELAEVEPVDPETVASTHINLGLALVWQKNIDEGIEHYLRALEHARGARLRVVAERAHYNLAEAYYLRFLQDGRRADEHLGDLHTTAALAALPPDADPATADGTRRLKKEVLGQREAGVYDRLQPAETAAHYEEMNEVRQLRERLAVPQSAPTRIDAHLSIAAAYVAVAVKEREAALGLIEAHGLQAEFDGRVQQLRLDFDRGLTRARRLRDDWSRQCAGIVAPERIPAVLQHLLESGPLSKSSFAALCDVSPGTASKHLAALAGRGLLQQIGRGPMTRYALPD